MKRLDTFAAPFLGTPFKLKAREKDCFDCYGLLVHVLAAAGLLDNPETSDVETIRHLFAPVRVGEIQPGDVVIMDCGGSAGETTHVTIKGVGSRYWSAERKIGVAQVSVGKRRIKSAYRLREGVGC